MIRRAAVLTAAVLLLAGCTVAPEPVVTPTPTPTPTVVALPEPAHGVVGAGTLDGVPFEVTWDGYQFTLTGFEQVASGTVQLSAAAGVVGECTEGYALRFGLPSPIPLPLATAEVTRDLTFVTAVSMIGAYTDECYGQPVLSTAPISWSMTPLYPDLVVTDSGETGGAKGAVILDGEVLVGYRVNQGDVLAEIAARFGLTTDQLVWLNPRRENPDMVYTDETLNLSPQRR